MERPTSFGQWLKLRRRLLDLTQGALARAVGCSTVTIRKLEADERRPSRQIAERLAACLQIAPSEHGAFIGLARAEPWLGATPEPGPLPELAPQRPRSNLPVPLTSLMGRKADVGVVRSALLRGDTRLLTLSGPGGVGKTRLALQAARELRDAFADGICFVDLAAIRDPDLVLTAVAHALGLRESGGQPLVERLHDYLAARRTLLLLDNFEQLLAAAPLVVKLLEASAGLKALITSRTALRVRGEQVVLVAPLQLPDRAGAPTLHALAQNPAVALFVERVRAAQPAFALTAANAPAVAELCARLDGLPLAIELVAARAALLSPQALLARLDQGLELLTDGPRDLPERHQTLRAALAGSYELLEPAEQRLFRRLSLFVGGWTLESAEAVAALSSGGDETAFEHGPGATLRALSALVAHSLVLQRPSAESAPRFGMLETIREYAREQLAAPLELAAAQRAHAAYFLELAERALPELHGPQQVAWLSQLEADYPNLRAALEWSLHAGELGWSLRLAGALGWFWYVRGYSSEGLRWLGRALAASQPPYAEPADRPAAEGHASALATALSAAGHLALFQGDFAQARMQLEASVALWRALSQAVPDRQLAQQGLAFALNFLFLTLQFQGDSAAREALLAEYMALSAALRDPRSQAMLLFNLGRGALLQLGDYGAAQPRLEQALALFRPLGDLWHIAQVVIDLGLTALYQERYTAAAAWYTEGLALAHTLRDRTLVALALNNLGEVARCQGDREQAARLYAESLRLHQELGNKSETPRLLHNLGYVALRGGNEVEARAYFQESLTGFQQLGMTRGVAEGLAAFAALAAAAGRDSEAARLWGAAEALHEAGRTPVWPTDRREQAHYQAIARARLDPAAWEAAWVAGRANPHALADTRTLAAALKGG